MKGWKSRLEKRGSSSGKLSRMQRPKLALGLALTLVIGVVTSSTSSFAASKAAASGASQDSVSIVMVGDVLLHTPVEDAARDEAGNYNFDAIFSKTKNSISKADLALVNQEVIIGGQELGVSGYPAFNAPYEIGDALAKAGFDEV